jgi:AcrR family transcriptional regulator
MNETRKRIVAEGLDLLARGGFAGVTLGVLATQTGLSKSGLFAHFGSKTEVQLRLLDETAETARKTVVEPAMKAAEGLPRLRAVFERWLGWSEKAGLGGGCPVTGGFFEFDDAPDDDPVRQRLIAMEAEWRAFLSGLTAAAVKAGELRKGLDVDQFVWELCGIYLSHHVSYRFAHDPLATKRAHTAFAELVNRSRAHAVGKKPRRIEHGAERREVKGHE